MSALDELPADQRAVLELVLVRGRDYSQIAALLGVDRAGVRDRALAAMDALAPTGAVPQQRRALIADYLLGQLPAKVSEDVRARLEREAGDRAWAQALIEPLSALAGGALPEVPLNGVPAPAASPGPAAGEPTPAPVEPSPAPPTGRRPSRASSRRGGAVLLVLGVILVIVVAVILIIVLSSGSSSHGPGTPNASTPPAGGTTSTGAASSTAGTTSSTATTPPFLANVTLSPVTPGSTAKGEAAAFNQSGALLLAIVAVHLAPNSTAAGHRNYYAVWLENSPTDSRFLGFAQPVKSDGQLRAATTLKSTDSRYKKMVLTLESASSTPKTPGTVVLEGPFSLKTS